MNSKKFLNNKYHNITVLSYLNALEESYLIYKVKRYDLKGKRILTKLDKYYSVDPGFRYAALEDIESNRGFLLENIVFLELKRRGFEISVGKINNIEVDFYAKKNGKKYFIQVTESLENPEVKIKETKPFYSLKEIGRKIILTNQDSFQENIDDIEVINVIDFLLNREDIN